MVVPAQSKTTRRILVSPRVTCRLQIRSEMLERGRLQALDLGHFIVPAQRDGSFGMGMAAKFSHLVGCEWTALKLETQQGCLRKLALIRRVGRAKIPFGWHMQTHRLGDFGPEVLRQPAGAKLFVSIVDALLGTVFGEIMQQVPDVVQQRRGYQRGT